MIWWYIVVFIVVFVVFYVMMFKLQNVKLVGFGDIIVLMVEVGWVILVLFGMWDLKGFNVCWYGDFWIEVIKVKGGKK